MSGADEAGSERPRRPTVIERVRAGALDQSLPPVRLPQRVRFRAALEFFWREYGADLAWRDPRTQQPLVPGARRPAYAELRRLQRAFDAVPPTFVRDNPALGSVLISDELHGGGFGTYRPHERRIIIWYSGHSLTQRDPLTSGAHSVFAVTVLHEIGESAWYGVLTEQQRRRYGEITGRSGEAAQESFANELARAALRPEMLSRRVDGLFRELGLVSHTSVRPGGQA